MWEDDTTAVAKQLIVMGCLLSTLRLNIFIRSIFPRALLPGWTTEGRWFHYKLKYVLTVYEFSISKWDGFVTILCLWYVPNINENLCMGTGSYIPWYLVCIITCRAIWHAKHQWSIAHRWRMYQYIPKHITSLALKGKLWRKSFCEISLG